MPSENLNSSFILGHGAVVYSTLASKLSIPGLDSQPNLKWWVCSCLIVPNGLPTSMSCFHPSRHLLVTMESIQRVKRKM